MDNDSDIVRRLIWGGLLAIAGALASVAAHRAAAVVYKRAFHEDPPE